MYFLVIASVAQPTGTQRPFGLYKQAFQTAVDKRPWPHWAEHLSNVTAATLTAGEPLFGINRWGDWRGN